MIPRALGYLAVLESRMINEPHLSVLQYWDLGQGMIPTLDQATFGIGFYFIQVSN